MILSLDTLLRTGQLSDLEFGMPKEEVQALLGPPDDVGVASRRNPYPSLLLYGTVELSFFHQEPHGLIGISWEAAVKGSFHLTSACRVADWALTPDLTLAEVEAYPHGRGILFDVHNAPNGEGSPTLVLANGVDIFFDEGRLWGIFARHRLSNGTLERQTSRQ